MSETLPADELSPVRHPIKPRPARERDSKGRFKPKNGVALMRHGRLPPQGLLKRLEDQAPKEVRLVREQARKTCRYRISELVRLHGDLSSGVCATLLDGHEQRADARYIRALAMTPDAEGKPRASMIELLRLSIQLSNGARQSERDAWELASREADARKRAAQPQPTDLSALLTAGEQAAPDLSDRPRGDGDSSATVPGEANPAKSLGVSLDCESSGRGDCHENSTPVPPSTPPGGLIGRGAPPSNEAPEKPDDD